jgi:nucleoside-diphosphate-sugar epimerase
MTSTQWDGWYGGRGVLVIGGLGFIGASLSRRLLSLGAACTIVTPDRAAHQADTAALLKAGALFIDGDLRDAELMRTAVKEQAVVFNLSGRSGAVRSMEDPLTDLDVNCRGNLILLEALRAVSPAAKVVFPGSRLEYGRPVSIPVAEDDPLDPLCVHAVHKVAVESYLKIYRQLYGLRSTVLRITNPFGPGQPAGRSAYGIVNRMIQLALDDQPLTIFGDGRQLRDYLYIDDTVDALVAAGAAPDTDGQAYNVGSGIGTPLVDMARTIIDLTGSGRLAFQPWPVLAQQIETGDFVADISRLHTDTGWAPATMLADGLRRTIDAYRVHTRV